MKKLEKAGNLLAGRGTDPGSMRPFIGNDGNAYVMAFNGGDKYDEKNYTQVQVDNAVLRYDEWRSLDDAVVKVAEQRLVGFDDLRSYGLVHPLANAMGTTVLTWENMSDAMEATVSIDPVQRDKGDQVDFETQHIPIPVIHSGYSLSDRILQESRNRGNGLDTVNAERAARKVAEKMEDMLFGATSLLTYGGGTIYTYVTHPDVNDVTLSTNWDASAKTPAQILADVIAMKAALIADRYYGPYVLYIPSSYDTVMDEDYDVAGTSLQTIKARIEAISGIDKVVVVDRLPDDKCVMVTMRSDVVDLVDGMPIQNVQWDTEGGFIHNYKVMAIQVPRVRSEYGNRSGIALLA